MTFVERLQQFEKENQSFLRILLAMGLNREEYLYIVSFILG